MMIVRQMRVRGLVRAVSVAATVAIVVLSSTICRGIAQQMPSAPVTPSPSIDAAKIRAADLYAGTVSSPNYPYLAAFRAALRSAVKQEVTVSSTEGPAGVELDKFDYDARLRSDVDQLVQSAKLNTVNPLIYYGTDVPAGQMPEVVEVNAVCTGTIIAPNAVLTAAHCACPLSAARKVYVTNSINVSQGDAIQVVSSHVPDGVDCSKLTSRSLSVAYQEYAKGDIAILLLNSRTAVKPDAVVADTAAADSSRGTIVGFGYTETGTQGDKKFASTLIVSSHCLGRAGPNSEPDATYYGCVPEREAVAQGPGGVDTCAGDSGGPIFVSTKAGDRGVLGVTSRGVVPINQGCGHGGIYARVDSNLQFIQRWVPTAKIQH